MSPCRGTTDFPVVSRGSTETSESFAVYASHPAENVPTSEIRARTPGQEIYQHSGAISLFYIIFAAQLCSCWYVVFIWIHLKGSIATIANHSSNKKPWHVLDMCNCPWNSRDNPRVVPVWVAYSWPSRPSRPKFPIGRPETQLLEKLHQSACGWDGYGMVWSFKSGISIKGNKVAREIAVKAPVFASLWLYHLYLDTFPMDPNAVSEGTANPLNHTPNTS